MSKTERYDLKRTEGSMGYTAPGIIEYSERYKAVQFPCPCGCGLPIYLPSTESRGEGNKWHITISEGNLITIEPSIAKMDGCRSHFHIRDSKVVWA